MVSSLSKSMDLRTAPNSQPPSFVSESNDPGLHSSSLIKDRSSRNLVKGQGAHISKPTDDDQVQDEYVQTTTNEWSPHSLISLYDLSSACRPGIAAGHQARLWDHKDETDY